MAQLHHKWCVHSILPVASRVMQISIKTLHKAPLCPHRNTNKYDICLPVHHWYK